MATKRRIKIWIKMIFGKSELHLKQNVGRFFDKSSINGYYNDLTNKVLFNKKYINDENYIPEYITDYEEKVYFPVAIIQYGLGCIDLYIQTNEAIYLKKAIKCGEFIYGLVDDEGKIEAMSFAKDLKNPFSAMCQGEAISLFSRLYKFTLVQKYNLICDKIYNFLIDYNNVNAVSKIGSNGIQFYEYPDKPLVLNGYIFALFGVFDYYLLRNDVSVKQIFENSVAELKSIINKFIYKKWSYYDLNKNYTSPFYHFLHISLLTALTNISDSDFSDVIEKYKKGYNSRITRFIMFIKKALQKL